MRSSKSSLIGLLVGAAAVVLITALAGPFSANGIVYENPHPTPPSNSVTNAMLTSSTVKDNVVASNAAIAPTKIATDTNHGWITEASQTLKGVKTFDSIPLIPTSSPTSSGESVSYAYASEAFLGANTTGTLPTLAGSANDVTSTTFTASGTETISKWRVPIGVTSVTFNITGAQGYSNTAAPGDGGASTGTLAVIPGQLLYYCVGVHPTSYTAYKPLCSLATSTSNVGGGDMTWIASSSTFATSTVYIVAGVGGGGASETGGNGGGLNGTNAGSGTGCTGGNGASQTAGGLGGAGNTASGVNGSFGVPGEGTTNAGASGGAGWYGGGEGGNNSGTCSAGGGGGSGFISSALTNATTTTSGHTGDGTLTITYTYGGIAGNSFTGGIITDVSNTTGSVTFNKTPFTGSVSCVLTPNNSTDTYFVSSSLQGFTYQWGNALTVGQSFNYICMGY